MILRKKFNWNSFIKDHETLDYYISSCIITQLFSGTERQISYEEAQTRLWVVSGLAYLKNKENFWEFDWAMIHTDVKHYCVLVIRNMKLWCNQYRRYFKLILEVQKTQNMWIE